MSSFLRVEKIPEESFVVHFCAMRSLSTRTRVMLSIGFVLVLYVILPLVCLMMLDGGGIRKILFIIVTQLFGLLIPLVGYVLVGGLPGGKIWRGVTAVLMALMLTVLALNLSSWKYIGHPIHPTFFFEQFQTAWLVIYYIFGLGKSFLFAIGFSIVFCIALFPLREMLRHIPVYQSSSCAVFRWIYAPLFLLLSLTAYLPYNPSLLELRPVWGADLIRAFPDNSVYTIRGDENVIILELESLNALAADGLLEIDGKSYKDDPVPRLHEIAREGVFFPLFWGQTVTSERSRLLVYCGDIHEVEGTHLAHTEEIPTPCIPELFERAGYGTVFLSSVKHSFISHADTMMPGVGFRDTPFTSIMEENDPGDAWGYDDCTFYKRAFDYLRQTYPKRRNLFVNITATNNHYPYRPNDRYADEHLFRPAGNSIERYLNKVREQDSCLTTFIEQYRSFSPENTHLFIMSDTSWPLGINGATSNSSGTDNENFLIPLLYIPPANRRGEFALGNTIDGPRFSQSDLIPTIAELVSGTPYDNSFAFALRGEEEPQDAVYDDCQVLIQPYSFGGTVIVRDGKKYTYHYGERSISMTDLASDIFDRHPTVIADAVPYSAFLEEYLCDRYRP